MSVQTLERPTAPARSAPAPTSRRARWGLALTGVFALAVVYHWLESLGHVTPAVFTDELMFSELARSVAAGDGLTVRGLDFPFPPLVPVLLQAPAWLLGGGSAYGVAKALNAVLMCLAVFPAWWLARQVVRPAHAFVVAVAAVAPGALLYHSYLTSEAAAYPAFLLAVAVCVRAIAQPSRLWDVAAVAALGLAVLTRAQFAALPIAFVIAVVLVGRPLRRHSVSLVLLAVLGAAVVGRGVSGLGFYAGAGELDYPAVETLRWTGWTAALLPFAAGMLVVPGAVLGLWYAARRSEARAEGAFAVLALVLAVALPLQGGLIASGEAHRPLERYAFYLVPLVFTAFFLYVERGAPRRRVHAGLALGLGGVALAVPFAQLATDPFSFDSPTVSAVAALGRWTAPGDAAALFATGGLLAALAAAALPLRRFGIAVAAASIVLAFAIGVAAYSGDRRMTHRVLQATEPAQPDWLDRTSIPSADLLVLPGASLHRGWLLESWNRKVERVFHLGDVDADPLPYTQVGIGTGGAVLETDGKPLAAEHVVVDESASRVELAGERLAEPTPGLTLYRVERPLRLRWLAEGLYPDGWARAVLDYTVGANGPGAYEIALELPNGWAGRSVAVEAGPIRTQVPLTADEPVRLRIPVSGSRVPPLAIRIDRADLTDGETAHARLVGARVTTLRFVPASRSRNR